MTCIHKVTSSHIELNEYKTEKPNIAIVITLLGEVFLFRIILESDLKLQPVVVIGADVLAVILLNQAIQVFLNALQKYRLEIFEEM